MTGSPSPEPEDRPGLMAELKTWALEAIAELAKLKSWAQSNAVQAALLLGIAGTLAGFFCFVPLFGLGNRQSVFRWALNAWNPSMNQEHSQLVLPIFLALIIYHWKKLVAAPKLPSNAGFLVLAAGILTFLASVRCLQPRLALLSVPMLFLGIAWSFWGKRVARIILFPCVFLIYMVPSAAIEQATFHLQFAITGLVQVLCDLIGIQIRTQGTTIFAADGSFSCQVIGDCSGIRSLIALSMLTAVYVHLTQTALWKKLLIFASSLVFAIVGNGARIFSIVLVAKFISPKFALGAFHEYSGFVFYPIALLAMLGLSKLLNMDFKKLAAPDTKESRHVASYDY